MREPAISLRGLVKRYDAVVAVDSLDLDIRAGECFGLLGPNGAGKTTTLEILVGLQSSTAGQVTVLGREWGEDDRSLRSRIGVSLQETRFPERLKVSEVVALFASFYPRSRDPLSVIREVGLAEKAGAWTSRLSGGQRQRLALACALVGDPELLILDEPTTGLDPQARLAFGDSILSYKDRGCTILVSTHSMEEAQRICDRVAIIDRGKVLAVGSPGDLIASLDANLVVEVEMAAGDIGDKAVLQLVGVSSVRRENGAILVSIRDAHITVPALLDLFRARSVVLAHLTLRQATLEDVYVSLTGRKYRDE
ncbi:MAG TPA: ABC transporter ATP-binding protein [Candidatus Deferrimicrobiaceae bacterium]|nr:ABC transporter ATP-binding protein [Candidatus Deferrimicrobiaceae bacterium]